MSTRLLDSKIRCKYLVIKFIEDEVKDEPINVGILLQSQDSNEILSKFITNYSRLKIANLRHPSRTILEGLLNRLEDSISSTSPDEHTLNKIVDSFQGKLRFTDIRGSLTDNPHDELDYLYNRYMSISGLEEYAKITSGRIVKEILSIIRLRQYDIRREYLVYGKKSHFVYDLALFGNINRFVHTISFDERGALARTKVFDWSVKDTIERDTNLSPVNFIPVVAEPSSDSPTYERVIEKFKDALQILTASNYPTITYQTGESWKKKLHEIVN